MKKIILLCITALWIGCNSDDYDIPSDPKEAILGKWQLIEEGNENGMKKASYDRKTEYFTDGELKMYDVIVAADSITDLLCTYKVDSEYLYVYMPGYKIAYPDDGRYIYTYHFYKNKLRLEYVDGLIPLVLGYPTTHIYKRIN